MSDNGDEGFLTAQILIQERVSLNGETERVYQATNGDGENLDPVRCLGLMQLAQSIFCDTYNYLEADDDE